MDMHAPRAGEAMLVISASLRGPKAPEFDAFRGYDFGVYEESFCAVGTQGAFQLRHAKKYKLWEHTL